MTTEKASGAVQKVGTQLCRATPAASDDGTGRTDEKSGCERKALSAARAHDHGDGIA
jgi:hypothetical protein